MLNSQGKLISATIPLPKPAVGTKRLLVLLTAMSTSMISYAGLETPANNSTKSGIGVIRGWVCDAHEITVSIDGGEEKSVAYGNLRGDTESTCGDKDNGFETLWNWNLTGDGEHTIVAYADGISIGSATFNVVTLGMSSTYVTGLSGTYTLFDFPTAGRSTDVTWSESDQNFVVSAASGTSSLPDTGQTGCYDIDGAEITCPVEGGEYYGQDAQYARVQLDYTDNGDGTVMDNNTGLTWQQTPDNTGLSWQEGFDYCERLQLGELSDWRLPTTKELFSVSDFSTGWPYLDTTYFNLAGTTVSKDEQYWTELYVGTTAQGGSDAAFGVNHGTGHIKAYPAGASGQFGNYVRCVSGDSYGDNVFVDNDDGTVTDHARGLMWEKSDSGEGMDWKDALAYAESSTTGGYDDWRLPNIKELQSIVDYTKSPSASAVEDQGPAIDRDFFEISELEPGTTNYDHDYGYFWSSTSAYFGGDSLDYYYAWYVAFGTAVDGDGNDMHGEGGMRFDTKYEGGALGEGGERYCNYVRLVRDAN